LDARRTLSLIVLSTTRIVAPLPGDRIPEFLSPSPQFRAQ
jgi:hypothetical protein